MLSTSFSFEITFYSSLLSKATTSSKSFVRFCYQTLSCSGKKNLWPWPPGCRAFSGTSKMLSRPWSCMRRGSSIQNVSTFKRFQDDLTEPSTPHLAIIPQVPACANLEAFRISWYTGIAPTSSPLIALSSPPLHSQPRSHLCLLYGHQEVFFYTKACRAGSTMSNCCSFKRCSVNVLESL